MNYQQTLDWLFAQLPMYQQQGASAYRKDLVNTILLANHLGNPELKVKTIHVAGTNGKGSSSSMIASVLQEAGYKVGLYTSPHLKDFRERIKINGLAISEDFVIDFVAKNKPFFEENNLSFFEMTVGLSSDYFAKQEIDVAVIEVGMGGRLDSTNIIKPLVSVITNIGLDHTLFLGNTLEAIANEKAGIIKPNTPVIVGEYNDKTKGVFLAKAKDCKADIYFASDLITKEYPSDLLGDYQQQNKKTAIQTIRVLKPHFSVSEENLKDGLLNVVKNTGLLGRWQQIHSNPKVICDTAHNSHGLKIVLNQIQKEEFDNLFFVLGFVNDKDLDDVLPLFPKKAKYFFSKPNIFRGLDAKILQEKATNFGLTGNIYNSITEAYKEALKLSSQNDFIYIGGSTFVVAEIL
ncbi:bifunctional folylpolyglutamate synthase/dihydrofolate synthase [Flavobacterium psychrophilum]|uniref:bifunctional folylpolyglutamate synthase/dihydrofolate synthase n=1 Tax=Flavobacterium psychrophilum TaxID=96345 RepID=UPI00073FA448|nr:folylpolyglutamate synthase/dihydrofolate synthase family protein [Flavobacterium psychrophilum]EKT4500158.1 bifunctional folylpolyglutamate synthase/dihydrofolate synthase [Flavobacterium psychrophilum]ELY2016594.1 bifunctional folylpolyglutamate synthase/dihydrofolate synthase [Flavobacterium psychrophilum]GAW88543.1 tetrahydrofolate synthase [Flavobacterium psychrophilum]GEJ29364.1 tetrahydrofolate synthase [Flavobacterium psychrophilum]GEJ29583.1 tetrahydrofolate synthase [Flavobacteriu